MRNHHIHHVLTAFLVAIIAGGVFLVMHRAAAQTAATEPRLFITWRADTYAPAYFSGKLMPTGNSVVNASVGLFDDGRFVDLSMRQIYWYLNGEFAAGGVGLQRIYFRTPSRPGDVVALRAQLPDYRGKVILKTISVPVVFPEAVIEAPAPIGKITGDSFLFFARPFFFNVKRFSDLVISWQINGQPPEFTTEPETLALDLTKTSSGATVGVALDMATPNRLFESGRKELFFVVE